MSSVASPISRSAVVVFVVVIIAFVIIAAAAAAAVVFIFIVIGIEHKSCRRGSSERMSYGYPINWRQNQTKKPP